MIITSCGNSVKIAKKIATQLKCKYNPLKISCFPDGDMYMKYSDKVKGQEVVIVHSFQPNSDLSMFRLIWAAAGAKQQGAKKVILVAPYLAYMRQDKMFNPGEVVSARVMAKLVNTYFDKLITIDPHLHRIRKMKEVFKNGTNLTANSVIGDYVKKKIKNAAIIGPDWESYQWAEAIAKIVGCEVSVFRKTRFSGRHVESEMIKKIDMKGKNVVIVDDIISTGHTIIEASKKAKHLGAKSVTAIGVHGLFVEGAVGKLKKAGIKNVLSTNCIEHPTNAIDVTSLLVKELRKRR
ncbi:MAG: ribose-phosphate diphosphokinase [archaeon]|nr:ribose-phosphate diphosphokinase [Nanoarchaeota archaeon]